ncbi:MAG TPA: lysylphosphatidylglycerol synthase transmembrane domain-containing protein, partial [bacterium]|nr:lysylphosphatidylglycerol synthase transmembrane domain-containing protein [bacterium]
MSTPNRKTLIIVSLVVVGIMVLALATALMSDISKLVDVFHHMQVDQMIFALLCTGIAYLSFTLSFNGLFAMTPHRIPFPKFFSIMFISYTINFIVSTGGWAGIAIRAFLLRHEKVPYSVTIPLSFAQNMIFNLVLACVCFGGLFYLHNHPEFMGGSNEMVIFFFMGGLFLVVTLMLLIFFNTPFRRWFLRTLIKTGNWFNHKILRKKSDNKRMVEIRNEIEQTVAFLHKGWIQLLVVFFWVSMDWCFTALTLFFCFHAVGVNLPLGLLMVGFTVMFLSSNISPVPAGLGVSEALLAFVFNKLGVGFEKTLVAALLFRFVFFLIPLALSTALYL